MMDFRARLEQNRVRPVDSEPLAEPEDNFACPYFAADRIKTPACLDLRLPDGVRKALPYCYFMEINFDVEAGIEILTNSKKIIIKGRNLTKLFDYLMTYRVRYVQANIGNDRQEDGLFVKDILIEDLNA